ncbi:hypothetical protein [Oleiphilus sp. HI0125]|uniref:hypothetical protein n=2 Tax=Oleiphilus sp. HI0125 TaxID=1822266 RepID=UPI000A9D4C81|nr:hypothetical protein [Oleiphilus sp. HI0125]
MPKLIHRILSRLFYWDLDAYICFREDLTKPRELHSLPKSLSDEGWKLYEVDLGLPKDMQKLSTLFLEAFPSYQTLDDAKTELDNAKKRGDKCIVVANDNEFKAMSWLGQENNRLLQTVGKFMDSRHGIGVIHRSYVSPSLRGHKLQQIISSHISDLAKREGKEWLCGFAGVQNFSSIRNRLQRHDEYRLVYHLTIETKLRKWNIFPKLNKERWKPCS